MENKITENWLSTVKSYNIDSNYYDKVSLHIDKLFKSYDALNENQSYNLKQTLSIELRIISKINDLSKIIFINDEDNFKIPNNNDFYILKQSSVAFDKRLLKQNGKTKDLKVKNKYLFDIEGKCEEVLIEDISKTLNKEIESGKTIYCYMLVKSVKITDEPMSHCYTIISKYSSI